MTANSDNPARPARCDGQNHPAAAANINASVTPCFTPGTAISTPHGAVGVENQKVGDAVITRDNGVQRIRWVGSRRFGGRELAANPHLYPILIQAGALGHDLPQRDMRLSPNHRVLVSSDQTALYFKEREVFVAAKHLVNNRGVYEVESLSATYIHFLFDRHEVVMSNGSWSESFQPADQSLRGIGNAQRQEIIELFPDLRDKEKAAGFSPARRVLSLHEAQQLTD